MARIKKTANFISFSLIVVAFLFLFNPNVAVIDPLPDFIGYILLCAAISKLSDVHDRLSEAYVAFKKMIFIDGGKMLAILWIFGITLPSERNSSIMLWSFIFAVLEFIFLLPAYNKLFDGMTQLGYLYVNTSVFGENKRISYTDRIKILTYIFIPVKAVLSFLPELADLTNVSYDETMGSVINLYRYIGLLRGMAFIPVFILGLIWLFSILSYFKRITKDVAFVSMLSEKYERDVRPKIGKFVQKGFFTFTILFVIALVFTADIRIDNHNIFPDFLAAAFFILAFVYIGRYNGQKKTALLYSSIAFLLFSVASSVCEYIFFEKYYYGAIIRSDAARNLYIALVVINVIKSGCFMWVLTDIYKALNKLIMAHTGFVLGMERSEKTEEKMVHSVQADLKKEINRAIILAAIYVISDICFDIFAPKVNFIGAVNIGAAILCIFFFIKAFSEIREAIETKYMLE